LLNQQGLNIGTQYRSVIFYHDEQQKAIAERSKQELQDSGKYDGRIATEIEEAGTFYPAEEKHQRYLEKGDLRQAK
ncbi:MAG: peptide-methionine (S)-S-oxide reductase, partial [Bacteroidales bacterium]